MKGEIEIDGEGKANKTSSCSEHMTGKDGRDEAVTGGVSVWDALGDAGNRESVHLGEARGSTLVSTLVSALPGRDKAVNMGWV